MKKKGKKKSAPPEETFETRLEKVDPAWRDEYKEACGLCDRVKKELFSPDQPWAVYEEKNEYAIRTRTSTRGLITCYSNAKIHCPLDVLRAIFGNLKYRFEWDENLDTLDFLRWVYEGTTALVYTKTKKVPKDSLSL